MSLVCVKRSGAARWGRHGRARSARNVSRYERGQRPQFDPLRRGTGQGRGGMRYLGLSYMLSSRDSRLRVRWGSSMASCRALAKHRSDRRSCACCVVSLREARVILLVIEDRSASGDRYKSGKGAPVIHLTDCVSCLHHLLQGFSRACLVRAPEPR